MINPTQKPWRPVEAPALNWQEDVPAAAKAGDIYFSTENGLAESNYVFLEGNQLRDRWCTVGVEQPFVIGEVGCGTGLNACLTLAEWLKDRPEGGSLHYIAIDHAPLSPADAKRALSRWPELAPILTTLIERWPDPIPGCHRRHCSEWGVTLDFWWGDAAAVLTDLASHGKSWVDAWYLDGFAPSREQGPWQQSVYDAMAALSQSGSTFATFTAAGAVRRGLTAAGFTVHKRRGYGSKRDALFGHIHRAVTLPNTLTPWDLNPQPVRTRRAIVLGAGLAGAHAARALAMRGLAVTVLEAGGTARGGSGNHQGVTYTRLSHQHNPLTDFSVAAFEFAADQYQSMAAAGDLIEGEDYGAGGYIQLHDDDETLEHLRQTLPLAPGFARVVSAEDIAELTGCTPRCGGIHYLRGGWLNPGAVCHALLAHPRITLKEGCGRLALGHAPDGAWQVLDGGGKVIDSAPIAILATAYDVTCQSTTDWLPLNLIRGQTTHIPSCDALAKLKVSICDKGYLPPARAGLHCAGSSFGPGDADSDERPQEHAQNIGMMLSALPDLTLTEPTAGWQGHVAHRCNSNDYLPVAGVVPDLPAFNAAYDRLRHDRKRLIDVPCPTLNGLGVLTSLGSRGLSAAPLAAEVLADQLLGGIPAVPRYLQRAIAPARFAERALKRGEPL